MSKQMINTIVFDLDGTLYEDTHHFDYFAKQLEQKLPQHLQEAFNTDYHDCLNGQHPLQIGRIYDVNQDLILIHEDQQVLEALRWDGTRLEESKMKQLYPNRIAIDLTTMISVGDLWWVPSSIAYHYQLDPKKGRQAFLETREYMMGDQFQMTPIPGLKDLLEELYPKHNLVLLTNSPEPDSEAILAKLGLQELFHKKIFDGKKPVKTKEWFETIKNTFGVNYSQIVSIGDNWINEILPASVLGCNTISIDTYRIGEQQRTDFRVYNMSEAFSIIRSLTGN